MSESFGARLRQRREQQQISLSTIAEQTKIKLSLLEALERGDVSHWPSGIFRRAFIRAYAHAIGLEPDAIVREFLELYPDPAEIVEPIPALAATLDGPVIGGTRLRYLVASAVGTIARRRSRTTSDAAATVPVSPAIQRPAVAAPAPPVVPEAEPAAETTVVTQAEPRANAERVARTERVERTESVAGANEARPFSGKELARTEVVPPTFAEPPPRPAQSVPDGVNLPAIAELCTQLGRASAPAELPTLLQDAARILDASGLVVWIWDPIAAELYPAMAHGYSDRVLAQLPGLRRDANNATAAAFRAAQACVVPGDDSGSGALVLPLLTASGCAGVLALEMPKHNEERESIRAAAAIVAAQLAALVGGAAAIETEESVRSVG